MQALRILEYMMELAEVLSLADGRVLNLLTGAASGRHPLVKYVAGKPRVQAKAYITQIFKVEDEGNLELLALPFDLPSTCPCPFPVCHVRFLSQVYLPAYNDWLKAQHNGHFRELEEELIDNEKLWAVLLHAFEPAELSIACPELLRARIVVRKQLTPADAVTHGKFLPAENGSDDPGMAVSQDE